VSHTHQLKQSRASNLSSKTDKKPRRDESSQKSNYYDIDVNDLFKGSTYKEIKENLEKNTNKKASSGTALVTDRKCNIKKMELSSLANSQYFFDPVPN
jgi:phage portal protein BeeE